MWGTTMRTFDEIESPTRRKLHLAIGLGVIGVVYLVIVALIRGFFV